MSEEHFNRFFPAICAGLGLFLAGGANLILLRRAIGLRIVATLAAVAIALGAAWATQSPGAVTGAARLMALVLVPLAIFSSRRLVDGIATLISFASRPAFRFGLLVAAGVGIAIGSVMIFETADEQAAALTMRELELLQGQAECIPSVQADARTDQGTKIVLKEPVSPRNGSALNEAESLVLQRTNLNDHVIRRGPAGDHSNCHGWVFTGGQFQVTGSDVAVILKENAYWEVQDPRPGDLVVYRTDEDITHTAVVRYVAEGQPILVEGKWGNLGVYIHPVDQSVYGTNYSIYRSPRNGHLLVGIGGSAALTCGSARIIPAE